MATTWVLQHADLTQDALYELLASVINAGEPPPIARPTVAAVGVATDFFQPDASQGVTVLARNQDGTEGQCAFYHVALGGDRADLLDPQILVETGTTSEAHAIEPASFGGWSYATEYWHIYFSRPFLTPPVVLVSAVEGGSVASEPGLAPVQCVGQAHDVTPYGFTLVARNASDVRGKAFLHWVALGCSEPFLV